MIPKSYLISELVNHAPTRSGVPQEPPCFGPGVPPRRCADSGAPCEEPGLPSEREAQAVRVGPGAQGELRAGGRRGCGEDQPGRQLHHQWIPGGIYSHSF